MVKNIIDTILIDLKLAVLLSFSEPIVLFENIARQAAMEETLPPSAVAETDHR